MDYLTSPFELAFVQRGVFELLLLSVGAGLLGTWIVLRGLAFYSHAVGTAAFPGLVVADGLGFAAPIGALAAALVFAAVLARMLGACSDGSGGSGGRVDVVATTTQIGDWTREVGGSAVDVHQILKPNVDPHTYEPRPSDVEAMAGADV